MTNFAELEAENAKRVRPANITNKFRESFETYDPISGGKWMETKAPNDIVGVDGNAASASYLVISTDPMSRDTETVVESVDSFDMPFDVSFGLHTSQRVLGFEFGIQVVSTDAPSPPPAEIPILSMSQTTTTLTATFAAPHGRKAGQRVSIADCLDSRFNYPALVIAGTPTETTMTMTAGPMGTIPSLTAAATGGTLTFRPALGYARDGTSMLFEGASQTQASFYVRSDSGDSMPSGTASGSHTLTTGTQVSAAAIASAAHYALNPTTEYRLSQFIDGVQWSDVGINALTESTSRLRSNLVIPSESKKYKLRFSARVSRSATVPIAQIVRAEKTGTTTATFTCDRPHGLNNLDQVMLIGIRDQATTGFPNITSSSITVLNATQFTAPLGTAGAVTSFGGFVARVNGGFNAIGQSGQVVQSAALSTLSTGVRVLTLVGSANWAGATIGDYVNTLGIRNAVDGGSLGVDGVWRIRNFSTTTLELEALKPTGLPADFTTINCGGSFIRRTDLRISFVRIADFGRLRVEALPRPTNDASTAFPVSVKSTVSVTGTANVTQGTRASNGGGWRVQPDGVLSNDVASAALTSSATTSAITPDNAGGSAQFNVPVTAVSGTNPTLDVGIEESDDTGVNWYRIYDFPRITATGVYRTPLLTLSGNRLRYVQTVGGTTPSFTRTINRITNPSISPSTYRQIIDRTIVPNTVSTVTPTLKTNGATNFQLVLNLTAMTGAPAFVLEGSDDNGLTWYALGAPLAGAVGTSQLTVQNVNAELVRVRVSTAGVATLGYALLKAYSL